MTAGEQGNTPPSAYADYHKVAEALERKCHEDLHEAAPPSVLQSMGWRCSEVDGALVSVATSVSSILINRTLGLGVAAPATREAVAEICRQYAAAGVGRYFVHLAGDAHPPALAGWLSDEGLVVQRRWMKFQRDARPATTVADTPFHVARIAPKDGMAFGHIVANGFDLGDAAAGLFPPLVGRRHWHLFGAFTDEGTLAATGALFEEGGCGYLSFGATAPAHRRQGAQTVLLAARINAAAALGCTVLFTETGEQIPGDPQHSYHNIERAGFSPAYLRDNYAPRR